MGILFTATRWKDWILFTGVRWGTCLLNLACGKKLRMKTESKCKDLLPAIRKSCKW